MQFKFLNKRVVLHEIKDTSVKEVRADTMNIVDGMANISMIYVQNREEEELSEVYTLGGGSEKYDCPGLEKLLQDYEDLV